MLSFFIGFKHQAAALAHMFGIVEEDRIPVAIFDQSKHPEVTSNKQFLRDHMMRLLLGAFPHLQRYI